MQNLSKAIGKTLSSYTQAFNIEKGRTGNLFQKKTKAKSLIHMNNQLTIESLIDCGYYIHHNPSAARLVKQDADWEFSSFRDYMGLRNGTLCNKELFYCLTGREPEFPEQRNLSEKDIESFY